MEVNVVDDVSIKWYAVRVRSCAEFVVATGLRARDLDTFLPAYQSSRRWSDRRKIVEAPLFPGYVFAKFAPTRRLPVLMTSGVVNIVSFGTEPAPVPDVEIDSIRKIIETRTQLFPNPYLSIGKRVEVAGGPLRGVVGTIVAMKSGWRLVVSVHLLQRSIAVEIDMSMVKPYIHKPAIVSRPSQSREQVL
jgi:transcription antitermination factor NusG